MLPETCHASYVTFLRTEEIGMLSWCLTPVTPACNGQTTRAIASVVLALIMLVLLCMAPLAYFCGRLGSL